MWIIREGIILIAPFREGCGSVLSIPFDSTIIGIEEWLQDSMYIIMDEFPYVLKVNMESNFGSKAGQLQ